MRAAPFEMTQVRTLIARAVTLIALVAGLALAPAAVIGPAPPEWAPLPLQEWAFDVRLAAGTPAKSVSSLAHGSIWDKQLYLDKQGQTVSFQSQGLRLAGTLYRPATAGPHPGILLLHGSSPQGRKLGLYRLLGNELARRGYVVLAIDQRGYGQSDDPPDVASAAAFDYVADARHAVDYLSTVEGVDPARLYLIGHSFGGDVALAAGIEDPRLLKIVAIGPARRFKERGGTPNAPELAYFRRREMRYMKLSQPIPAEVFLQTRAVLPIENHVAYFARQGHKPILLIDGMLESAEDRQFLQEIYAMMVAPKDYLSLPGADHYANVANIGSIVIFDRPVANQLVQAIDGWLSTGQRPD